MGFRVFVWVPLLLAAAVIPYFYIFQGEYLFDDYHVIYTNQTLWKVTSLWDCFTFVLKPSKPVTNFLIALGHLITALAWGQRALSLFFHASVTLLFWSYLRRLKAPAPTLCAVLFAILPIHSETIAVGLFRMDILGTFFTLIALHAAESLSKSKNTLWWVALFLSLGLAQLSKEVFAAITPITLFVFYRKKLGRRFILQLVGMELLWATLLLWLLQKDAASEYPYGDVIGVSILGWKTHLLLSARALVEGVYKLFFGYGLTTRRLSDRMAIPHFNSLWVAAGVLIGAMSALLALFKWKSCPKEWTLCAAAGTLTYLAIPNINIGSEHYWYFPALGLCALLATLSGQLRTRTRNIMIPLYALSLLVALEHRVFEMKTRLGFHLAEIRLHPECAASWINAAVAVMERKDEALLPSAKTFIDTARTLAPNYPNLKVTEFFYHLRVSDKKASEQSLAELRKLFSKEPNKFSRYLEFYNLSYPHG